MIGIIYNIRSQQTDDIYIGYTMNKSIYPVLRHNRSNYKRYLNGKYPFKKCFEVLKHDDYYSEIISTKLYVLKDDLLKDTADLIRLTPNCINARIPGRSNKDYYIDNRESILMNQKQKVNCQICNKLISKTNISRHYKMHNK